MEISDLVALVASRGAEVIALGFEGGDRTYRERHQDTCRMANGLLRLASPRDRVAILTGNDTEYVLACYGVPLAGMALVRSTTGLFPPRSSTSSPMRHPPC